MPNRLFAPLGLAALLALSLAAPAAARDRGVQVSSDLAEEWILQLTPGSGVVPGYIKPYLANPGGLYDTRRGYAVRGSYGLRDGDGVRVEGRARIRSRDIKDGPLSLRDDRGDADGVRIRRTAAITGSVVDAPVASGRAMMPAAGRTMKKVSSIDPVYLPQQVDYPSDKPAGTVVIDTSSKFLYLVEAGGTARRYGVGVGKPGFEWAGSHTVTQKKEWPTWTPPAQMRAREKKKGKILPAQMKGGPQNPLGTRAMYLYDGGRDTMFRIHGTSEPWTIGHNVSSGCIRMVNADVADLYGRAPIGTKVIVR